MELEDDVWLTTAEPEQSAHNSLRHFRKYAEKCIELGIPTPFAAVMTRNAANLAKNLRIEQKRKLCQCHFCGLDLTSLKTVSFRLSVSKRKIRKNQRKRSKRPAQVIAICKGCGAEMKGGALAAVECENRKAETSMDESLRGELGAFLPTPKASFRETPTIPTPKRETKVSSSARRRKPTSKLQRILASQTITHEETSLQSFLDAFKRNI